MPQQGAVSRTRIRVAENAIALAPVTGEWASALEEVALLTGGWGCHLNTMAPDLGVLSSRTGGIDPEAIREFSQRHGTAPSVNQRAAAIYETPLMHVRSEADFTSPDEWRRSEFYQDFLARINAPYSLFGKLFETPKDSTCVTVLRSLNQGPASEQDMRVLYRLLPGLKESLALQRALDTRAINIVASSHSHAGVTSIICDSYLRVVSTSEQGEQALSSCEFLTAKSGKLHLVDASQQRKFQRAVASASSNASGNRQTCAQMSVTSSDGRSKLLAVAPLYPDESLVFGGACLVLLLDEPNGTPLHNIERPKLTASEVEIGKMLVRGQTTSDIASYRSVSKATVQTQIKALGAKLSSSHRAELLIALQNWFRQ